MSEFICDKCTYNGPFGDCLAQSENPNKFRACLKKELDRPTLAQVEQSKAEKRQERIDQGLCPHCEPTVYLINHDGCQVCPQCKWSKCDC